MFVVLIYDVQIDEILNMHTSVIVSRTAAKAASLSALVIPVFSAILAMNSGFLKVSTESSSCFLEDDFLVVFFATALISVV